MIYFTSDLHLCHNKDFLYAPRGFESIEEHDAAIIKNWNNIIQWDDDVYVLGDIMLNDNISGRKYWNQLNGNKFVIIGNHDTDARVELLNQQPRTTILGYANILKYHHYTFYLSHYPTIVSNYDADKHLKARVINLCAHSHTKNKFIDMDKGLIYHVELDAHDNKPVSIEQIIEDIKRLKGI